MPEQYPDIHHGLRRHRHLHTLNISKASGSDTIAFVRSHFEAFTRTVITVRQTRPRHIKNVFIPTYTS